MFLLLFKMYFCHNVYLKGLINLNISAWLLAFIFTAKAQLVFYHSLKFFFRYLHHFWACLIVQIFRPVRREHIIWVLFITLRHVRKLNETGRGWKPRLEKKNLLERLKLCGRMFCIVLETYYMSLIMGEVTHQRKFNNCVLTRVLSNLQCWLFLKSLWGCSGIWIPRHSAHWWITFQDLPNLWGTLGVETEIWSSPRILSRPKRNGIPACLRRGLSVGR